MPNHNINSPGGTAYTIDVPCTDRIALYQDLLTANAGGALDGTALPHGGALVRLEGIEQNNNYNKNTVIVDVNYLAELTGLNPHGGANYNLLGAAFTTAKITRLIESLVKIIDPWVAFAISLDINVKPFGAEATRIMLQNHDPVQFIMTAQVDQDPANAQIKWLKDRAPAHPDDHNPGVVPHFLGRRIPRLLNKPYDQFFTDLGGNIHNFWQHHPRIKTLIITLTDYFLTNIETCCQRVIADWMRIRRAFFPNLPMLELEKITPTGSDFHKGGKQVIILTFNTQRLPYRVTTYGIFGRGHRRVTPGVQQERLVYKPSDVELDCLLVGETGIFTPANNLGYAIPGGQNRSLLELIRDKLVQDNIILANQRFCTYKILPRTTRNVGNAYGYVEFLTFTPEIADGDVTNSAAIGRAISAFVEQNSRSWQMRADYILSSDDELKAYYLQWGRLMAMAWMFGISDMHWQNVRNHTRLPHLIDVEDSLKWPMKDVGETGAPNTIGLYATTAREANELQVVAATESTNDIRVAYLGNHECVASQVWRRTSRRHRIVQMDADKYSDKLKYVYRGFAQVMTVFHNHRADFVTWVNNALPGVHTRFVPIPTGEYYKRNFIYNALRDLRTQNELKDHVSNIARRYWAGNNGQDKGNPYNQWVSYPSFLLSTDANDFHDYDNGDIPFYYRVTNTRHLYNSQGNQVDLINASVEEQARLGVYDYAGADANHAAEVRRRIIPAPPPGPADPNYRQFFPDTQIQVILDNLNSVDTAAHFRTKVRDILDTLYNRQLGGPNAINFTVGGQRWSKRRGQNWAVA